MDIYVVDGTKGMPDKVWTVMEQCNVLFFQK